MEKNRVKVIINDVEYTLRTTENDEYVQRVALTVDKNMKDIAHSNSKLSTAMIGVLTSINLADRCIKAEDELKITSESFKTANSELERFKEKYEESELRLDLLKEEIQRLKIDLAKKDTELKNALEDKALSHNA